MAFGHFLLGSHNLMVTALGLCVKWPLVVPVQCSTPNLFSATGSPEVKDGGPLIGPNQCHILFQSHCPGRVINWAGQNYSSVGVVGFQNMCRDGFS
jgi:hypothetical protein